MEQRLRCAGAVAQVRLDTAQRKDDAPAARKGSHICKSQEGKVKTRTILVALLLASAAVSVSIIYGLWWLAGVV